MSISAFQAGDPGSSPSNGVSFNFNFFLSFLDSWRMLLGGRNAVLRKVMAINILANIMACLCCGSWLKGELCGGGNIGVLAF